ncbi:aspartate transaminase [Bradyrhizobium sp. BR13661]|jgi:aspartate aminotransferase|uniref:aspartate transaminase n=1 Tax=Bradyrhizobium sp. BR13661 TaxID=2940622 RepID=UPI002473B5F6|nr:aspartate transaminase [Bradyrhizobium sp. BR13661]MDH6258943.1 aspartate aminotransferase [Bradyrhizobium sp. BR13661]
MSGVGAIALAPRVQRIKPSPSMVARERVRQLQAEGRDVIDLTAGEPDLDTPKHIRAAAAAALEAGETRYTPVNGTPALRKAIIEKFARENGVCYAMNEISVGGGAKQVIYNALAATLGAGDEVIIPAPYWVSYPDMVEACDGTPVIVSCGENAGFKLSAEALAQAITPKTRWLILNSPCNPTGAFYSATELAALTEVLLRHPHVAVMTDDIYEHIRFDGGATPCVVGIEPRLKERTLLVNGVSKTYAMTGFRLGYGAGPAQLIAAMNTIQSQSTSCTSSISQAAATAALEGDQGFVAEAREMYRHRRDRAVAMLNDIPGLSCLPPDGAFYVFPSCAGLIGKTTPEGKILKTDLDIVMHFLDAAGVAVIDGTAYGMPSYLRMSIATSLPKIEEACTRLARACAALR